MGKIIIYEDRIYKPGEIALLDINDVMSGKEIFFHLKYSNEWLSARELNQKLGLLGLLAPKKIFKKFPDRIIYYKGKKDRYFFLSSIISDSNSVRNFSEEIEKEFEKLNEFQKDLFQKHYSLIDYMINYKTGNYSDPGFFEVAFLGFIKAIKIYNPNKGYKLKTHLCKYIGSRISNKFRNENKMFSLNELSKHEGFIKFIDKNHQKSVEEEFMQKELEDLIENLLSNLKPNEREVIEKRFCVGNHKDKKPLTMQELADSLDFVKANIHNIENRALRKMKKDPISNRLKVYVEK